MYRIIIYTHGKHRSWNIMTHQGTHIMYMCFNQIKIYPNLNTGGFPRHALFTPKILGLDR